MRRAPSRSLRLVALLSAFCASSGLARGATAATSGDPLANVVALAPRELIAAKLHAPSGIAVTPNGRILFTDERDGGLFEVVANGPPRLLKGGLARPRAVVWEEGERVLFLADGLKSAHSENDGDGKKPRGGLLLRFDLGSGDLTVLAEDLKHPRALFHSETSGVYLSAVGQRPEDDDRDDDGGDDVDDDRSDCEDDDGHDSFAGAIFRWAPATGLVRLAEGFSRPDSILVRPDGMLLVAASGYGKTGQLLRGSVFAVDPGGAVSVLVSESWNRASGLARDGTGALFLSAQRPADCERRLRGVVRRLPEGDAPNDFASGLDRPGPLAIDGDGHLLAVDPKGGVIVRFRAPPRPVMDPTPSATPRDPIRLTGTAEPGSRILVLGGREAATAPAGGGEGSFEAQVPLVRQRANELRIFAVGSAGQGLASPAATVRLVHDDIAPTIAVSVDRPPNDAGWYNAGLTVVFVCSDGGSGIARCPPARWVDTEGADQVIEGTATDEAGNSATASVTVSLDKTPPSLVTSLSPRPNAGGWNATDVTVGFACEDALSGPASCPPPVAVTTEGASQPVAGAASDRAGNGATATATLNVDKTPPAIVGSISPRPGSDGWNDTDVTIFFECTDATSGVASCPEPIRVTTEVARRAFTGTAVDKAGHRASATVTVNVDKTPLTPHPVAVDPPSLDFGEVAVGASATLDLTVTNVDGGPVTIDSIAFGAETSDEFAIVSSRTTPATLVTGGTIAVRVRYAPTRAGEARGSLRVLGTAGDAAVPLAGVGAGSAFSVAPLSLDFGAVSLAQEESLTATIRNTGGTDLQVSSVVLDGFTSADFSVASPATPFMVAAGREGSIVVRYRPAEVGARRGSIAVLTTSGSAAIGLFGQGQAPAIAVDAPALDFGNVLVGRAATVTLRAANAGAVPLQVTGVALELGSGPAFALSPLPATPFILAPGEERALAVTFAPTTAGSDAARVEIRTEAGQALVPVSGRGVSSRIDVIPSVLAVGSVAVGQSMIRPLSIVNVGTAELHITSLALRAGGSADITLAAVPDLPVLLAPGATALVEVRYGPQEVGADTATLDVVADGPDVPAVEVPLAGNGVSPAIRIQPLAVSFSNVRVGRTLDRSFTVFNSGDSALDVDAPRLSATSSPEFSLATTASFTLAPGTSHAITLRFSPAKAGPAAGLVVMDTSAGPAQVALRGNGIAADIEAAPGSVTFDDVLVGGRATRDVTVRNVGSDTLNVTAATLTGSDAFALASTLPAALAPGTAVVLSVSYAPTAMGLATGILRITSDDDDEPITTVDLTGNGVAPVLFVSPPSLSFGDVVVGRPATDDITVRNAGTAALHLTPPLVPAGTSVFSVSAPATLVLSPGASTTVTVTYRPAQTGADTGTVSFESDGGSATVSLSGNGIQFTSLSLRPSSATLPAGDCLPLRALGGLTNGTSMDVTASTGWASLDATVAAVDADGLVSAKVPGETTVSAAFSGLGATAGIVVVDPGSLRIAMPCGEVSAGGTFEADVTVNAGTRALGAYAIRLGYDPAMLRIAGIIGGASAGFMAEPGSDPASFATGSTVFASYQASSLAAPVGAVSVARVRFEVLGAPGSAADVSLQAMTLAATDLSDIAWTNLPARVVVKP